MEALAACYDREQRGMQIIRLENAYQMTSRPLYYEPIQVLYQSAQKVRLTETQMETLAIIAYKQPVTRQEIDDIRGVKSEAGDRTAHGVWSGRRSRTAQSAGTPVVV